MATNDSMTEVDSTHELPELREAEKNDLDATGPENPGSAIDEIPDGGATAWLVVFGTWCTSFCSFGWINSVGVFQDYYEHNILKDYSSSTIAWIPSLQIFFIMAMGPVVGRLYDLYGPRRLILGGTLLHVFGLMMASLSTKYYQILLSQGICSAIGASAIFQPALSTVPQWFNKKRGAAFGICSTGSSLGGVIFPIMLTHLIGQVGFPWAMRISAFLILFLLIMANLTVRQRVVSHSKVSMKQDHLAPFREPKSLFLMSGFFLVTFGIFIPIDYVVVEARASGMGNGILQYLVPILNAASFFGRSSSGLIGDKLGRFNVFSAVCTMTGILILGLWIPASNNAALISFAAFFGFFSGAYISLSPALVAEISPPAEFGYRGGLLFMCGSIGGLVTNPIAGAILDADNGSFTGLKVFAGVFCLVGTVVVFGARLHETGFKLAAKY
ncbi:major facilitator superfamily domain-containing protein [Ilyonectria robusta]|uniref:major facilitator superfamily domain-containing protein n=1 Tax=Ilyonectria robusta TaxID=1079257 RepID=UPI001E8E5E8D|nr:major facilitator superfamily domain-containing protein [Ilyonectria robusta]KAH8687045.1 major facilitator superfamily domain-containing protein [Ilyonectria robusta]